MTGSLGEILKEALARKWAEDDAAHKQMEEAKPAPTGKQLFPVTNNSSRATFDYIKANPGVRSSIVAALTGQGYKANSVTSLITQMLRQGMLVISAGNVLRTTQEEYTPIKSTGKRKEKATMQKKKVTAQKQPVSSSPAGLAAIVPALVPVPTPVPVVVTNEVEHILNTLPIKQAYALYVELNKIFGEVK